MSELPLDRPADPSELSKAAHGAARGKVVYLTEGGERIAAIVPAGLAEALAGMSADQVRELLEDFADAAAARAARASIEAGEPLIPWEQVKAEAGL